MKVVGPLCKEQEDLEIKEKRTNKMAEVVVRGIYFVFATSWGYMILKDKPYLPWYLGGHGEFELSLTKEYIPFA